MVLGNDEIRDIARRQEGNLSEVPYAVLLLALACERRTVSLAIRSAPKLKQITIEEGVPVQCRSNLAHETLSRFMQSIGALDEAVANECFAEACSRGARFGDILIERDLITAEELRRILQKNLARKLLDGFSWTRGEFRISEISSAVDSSLRVNVPQLIVLGVTRFATRAQVDGSIGGLIGMPLALNPDPLFPLDGFIPSGPQRAIIETLGRGPHRIDELTTAAEIDNEELTRALFALYLIGVVVPQSRLQPKPRPTPPSRPATIPPKHPPADGPASPEVDSRRAELMEMALNYRRRDPFDLLGVDPDGFSREAGERFIAFAEKFAPWTYPDDLRADAARVFLAGARAFAELSDPDRREALLNRRRSPTQKRPPKDDSFRIETDLLDPEVQFRQGRALMAEGNYRAALEQLAYAADLDPQNGDYRAELAYCRFLYNPQAAGPEAVADLKKALRIDPDSGLVHFYLGEILVAMGLIDEARESYRRAIKPMAPDRRPIEALKKLPKS